MRPIILPLAIAIAASPCMAASNVQVLLESLFHYRVLSETKSTLASLETNAETDDIIKQTSRTWVNSQKKAIRKKLEDTFGDDARKSFSFFTTRYTEAEAAEDAAFLTTINGQIEDQPVESYDQLRQRVFLQWIRPEIDAAGAWIADLQTWLDLKERNVRTPTLQAWLARDEPQPEPVAAPTEPAIPEATLATAEAPLPDFNEADTSAVSPLDEFGALRTKRRDQKRAEAQTAMQQLAAKRKIEEDRYAARKAAAAQREADAVRAYAQKLASTEAEAMEQRKNTWGARIKRITVATVSGALGAVTSGAGSAAGAVVAEELFSDD